MSTNKVIFQITDPDLSTMSPNQLGIETTADATTGFKMLGYKDENDNLRRVLCKDQTAVVSDFTSAGSVNSIGGYYLDGTPFETGIEGTGTPNYLPKFIDSTSLGDSSVSDNGTIIQLLNNVYTSGILSISGSPYTQGIFNVFKDSTNAYVAGVRKSCGNHEAGTGWIENTNEFNIELTGNGKLETSGILNILPELTLVNGDANRVWLGKIEVSAIDVANNVSGFGIVECSGAFTSGGVAGIQTLALPVYSGSTIAITDSGGAICVVINSNPSATTSSSISIINNFDGVAILTYSFRGCLCDPATIPVVLP